RHLADKDIAVIFLGESVAAVDGDAGGAGEMSAGLAGLDGARDLSLDAQLGPQHSPGFHRTDALEVRRPRLLGDVDRHRPGLHVDAVVERPAQGFDRCFAGAVPGEAGVDYSAAYVARLATRLLEIHQVGHGADEDAAVPAGDRDRRIEVFGIDGRLVVFPVA